MRTEWEARLGRWGSPKHRANLKRLAFYLKSIGSLEGFDQDYARGRLPWQQFWGSLQGGVASSLSTAMVKRTGNKDTNERDGLGKPYPRTNKAMDRGTRKKSS